MNARLPDITPLIQGGNNWQYEAILQTAPDHFEAFVCSAEGKHSIGTFTSKAEAREAINQLKAAHEWELKGIREKGPNEFVAVVRGPRGTYTVGTFKTPDEAKQAVKDVLEARWNG